MNLVLFEASDLTEDDKICLDDRRFEHIVKIHRAKEGDSLKVGRLNGLIGTAIIEEITDEDIKLSYELQDKPPRELPLTLVVALPRPPTFKKILEVATAMGVKDFYFINAKRVEQSFWQSPILREENYRKHLLFGLEQSVDTVLPKVNFCRGFKDFLSVAPALVADKKAFVAHPYTENGAPRALQEDIVLSIGPEGGFIDYEIEKLIDCGFEAVHMGARILRVEHAVTALLASIFKSY